MKVNWDNPDSCQSCNKVEKIDGHIQVLCTDCSYDYAENWNVKGYDIGDYCSMRREK